MWSRQRTGESRQKRYGGSSLAEDDGMSDQVVLTQSSAKMIAHSGVDGGRSHGGILADDTRGTTDSEDPLVVEPRAQTESRWGELTQMVLEIKVEPQR